MTAIRTPVLEGLFDCGSYVDDLENCHLYMVQELTYADDIEYYNDNFFVDISDEECAVSEAFFVTDIEKMIKDELELV